MGIRCCYRISESCVLIGYPSEQDGLISPARDRLSSSCAIKDCVERTYKVRKKKAQNKESIKRLLRVY